MIKKIFSVLLTAAMLSNLCAFAQLSENDGVYSEDFEGYTAGSEILTDKTVIKEYTKYEPELAQNAGSQVMVVNSTSSADNTIFTNAELYNNELNVVKFKIGSDASPKLNWGSTGSVVFSYTNAAGMAVTDYIFDFAYSLVRHKLNGVSEKAICGFTPKKMYNCSLSIVKKLRNEKYYYDVTYTVDGKENIVSFETTETGTMRIGFKSTSANKVYVDDIEAYGFTLVDAAVNIADRQDVSVVPEIEVSFTDSIDEAAFVPENVLINSQEAAQLEASGKNKYIIKPSEPLEKNTEYTIDLSGVQDSKGNALKTDKFSFKTKNTAVIIDGEAVKNTSKTKAENILVVVPEYANGSMINKSVTEYEIQPEEVITPESNNFFVLTSEYEPVDSVIYSDNTGKTSDEFSAVFDS